MTTTPTSEDVTATAQKLSRELQEAAVKWTRKFAELGAPSEGSAFVYRTCDLADLYLASLPPADDGEPVTAEWAASQCSAIGTFLLAGMETRLSWAGAIGSLCIIQADSQSTVLACCEADEKDTVAILCPTRGHVRRLLAALGVEPPA